MSHEDSAGQDRPLGFCTRAVHAGAAPDPTTGARSTPIYQSTSFVFQDADHAARLFNLEEMGFIYSRIGNPTCNVLEDRITALEGGAASLAVGSGHAAQVLAFHALMEPGDDFLAGRHLYGGSINQFGLAFQKFGWNVHWVDESDPDNFRRALTPRTKAIFIESIANPGGVISDMAAIAKVAEEAGIPLIVDNTLATPALCRPLEHGASVVVHSATKFLGGHGNAIAGLIVDGGTFDWTASGKFPTMSQPNPSYHGMTLTEAFGPVAFIVACRAIGLRDLGPALSPMNAYFVLTGIETLPLRMRQHCTNALNLAHHLAAHEKVSWVSYPGVASDPYYALAQKYCPQGAGAVFTFGVKGGYEAGVKLVNSVQMFSHLANVGDTRSLIIHPASTTHRQLTEEQRQAAGAGNDVVRVSVGIEDAADIIADINHALSQI
ncbi:MAG: O-acetylhomoserine aminocarboxypropyltransferase [Alphaproteobacteria bacterium]